MSGDLKAVRKLTVWTSERTFWAEGAASAQALGNIQEENIVKMESGGVEEEFREGTFAGVRECLEDLMMGMIQSDFCPTLAAAPNLC